jgi:glycine cleavage system H protein
MKHPDNLKYSTDHEWIRVENEFAYVGITDFAQSQLGDIVYVDINTVGLTIEQFHPFGVVEAVKTVSDLFLPVSGDIIEVNSLLDKNPELLNTDPYGEGWIVKIKFTNLLEFEKLLNSEDYLKLISGN